MLIAACLAATTLQAQKKPDQAQVKWGTDKNAKEDGAFSRIIDDDGTTVYMLLGEARKQHLLQRMDGLKVTWKKPLELEVDKAEYKLEHVALTPDGIAVFTSYYDKKTDVNRLYASTYDQAGFARRKPRTKVAEIRAERSTNPGEFLIASSPDRSKVLLKVNPPIEKGTRERYTIKVLNADLGELWSNDVTLPYDQDLYRTENLLVDNDGSALLVGKKFSEKQESKELKRKGKPNYGYVLLAYTAGSSAPQEYPVEVPDKFLQDLTLNIGKDGDIICAGLYGNKESYNVRGCFFLRLDRATKKVVHQSYKAFSDDFITEYLTEKEAKKVERKADRKDEEIELPSYYLHDLVRRTDGGAVLVAEKYTANTVCYTDSRGSSSCNTHYRYNDLVVVSIGPDGNIEWASKVPKRQHSVNDGGKYSSCAVGVKGDKVYLIFNDSGENLYVKPGDKVHEFELKGDDALVVLSVVSGDGSVTREAMFSPERRDVILCPKDCAAMGNGQMFMYASRKNDYRFGLVDFQ